MDQDQTKQEIEKRMRAVLRALKFGDMTVSAGLQDLMGLVSEREESLVRDARMAQLVAEKEAQLLRSLEYLRR